MKELFRIAGSRSACSYLPNQTASMEVRIVVGMDAADYSGLLSRGYRRFGWQLFRPVCTHCQACRSLRVMVQQFTPSASERRVLRANQRVRVELQPLFVTAAHVDLYNRYQRFMQEHRGWTLQQCNAADYYDQFLSGATDLGRQWMYFEGDKLIGVSLMDEVADAISLVYFFYDPD